MRRAYCLLDVFTETPLAGNPLAVVLDADGLDDARMQAIAREFNLPETVFVFAPRDPVNTAALRIFTPGRELPFAGHPTVGAAALVAHLRAPQMLSAQDLRLVLEERVGDVVCVARHRRGQALAASFTLPRLPQELGAGAGGRRDRRAPRPRADRHRLRRPSAGRLWRGGRLRLRAARERRSARGAPIPTSAAGGPTTGRRSIATRRAATASTIAPACSPPVGASARTRRPARPPPPSPESSCASRRPATANELWSSRKASRWAGRAASRSACRSSAARSVAATIGGPAVLVGEGTIDL